MWNVPYQNDEFMQWIWEGFVPYKENSYYKIGQNCVAKFVFLVHEGTYDIVAITETWWELIQTHLLNKHVLSSL